MVLSMQLRGDLEIFASHDMKNEPLQLVLTGREIITIIRALAFYEQACKIAQEKQYTRAIDKKIFWQLDGHSVATGHKQRFNAARAAEKLVSTPGISVFVGEAGRWYPVKQEPTQ